MSHRMSDRELAEMLRAMPEPTVPTMAAPFLPERPRSLPRVPWRTRDLVLIGAAAAVCFFAVALMAVLGPAVVTASAVQFYEAGGALPTVSTALLAALVGWLAVELIAPRATV